MKNISILIADDHAIVRTGLKSLLGTQPGFAVVAEAEDGVEAVDLTRQHKPDVVVMDLLMSRMNGDRATAAIRADNPDVKVLVLTSFGDAEELRGALTAGASGALPKTSSQRDIIGAIRKIVAGEPLDGGLAPQPQPTDGQHRILSERQAEILGLVARGFTNQDISKALDITLETVKDHLKKIFVQLGAASRTEASTIATDLGLISRT